MSELVNTPQAKLGLGDTNIDPELLTKEIDHDFFDDPPEATASINIEECLQGRGTGVALMPNEEEMMAKTDSPVDTPMEIASISKSFPFVRSSSADALTSNGLDDSAGLRLDETTASRSYFSYDNGNNESGRSSSNLTLHLEVDKENFSSLGGEPSFSCSAAIAGSSASAGLDDFYSMHQSNATSPNYPRPKQCYQLQQRRRSYGSIRKMGRMEQFQPMNSNNCGLNGQFDELSSSSSSTSSSDSSDLSDSSETELESLDSDDEEFVDMLEKYFDYIDQGSEHSDLTEVSPLSSSLAASPLPSSFLPGGAAERVNAATDRNDNDNINLMTERLCAAADSMHIQQEKKVSSDGTLGGGTIEEEKAAFDKLAEDDPFFVGCRPKLRNLPTIISTTETVIISAAPKEEVGTANVGFWRDCTQPEEQLFPEEHKYGDDSKVGVSEDAQISLNDEVQTVSVMDSANEKKMENELKESKETSNSSIAEKMPKEEPCTSSRSSSSGCWSSTANSRTASSSSYCASSSSASSSFGSHNGVCGRRKRQARNYTFSTDQVRRIEKENGVLLRKIIDTQNRNKHGHKGRAGHVNHCHKVSSSSIARLRQQRRIEHENNILMRRLQHAKPSKEIGEVFCGNLTKKD